MIKLESENRKGIGYCGFACELCYNDCLVCCKTEVACGGNECPAGHCAAKKGINGCYACPEYPGCEKDPLCDKRLHAYNRYIREFGERALIDRMRVNNKNGVVYQSPEGSIGDYDKQATEEKIYRLLRYGKNDPYESCPEFETKNLYFMAPGALPFLPLKALPSSQQLQIIALSVYNAVNRYHFTVNFIENKIWLDHDKTIFSCFIDFV